MKFLLHLLMLALLSGASAEVVQNFERDCGQFFAKNTSPTKLTGPQYKQICQTLNGVSYYATLYDINNRIPVYSAYKFEGLKDCERDDRWRIEPQLDDNNGSPNMQFESQANIIQLGNRQALNEDYVNSNYDRGHLAPVYQSNSQSCADATFTLTNAAPQNLSFNRGQWKKVERNVAKRLSDECVAKKQPAYIVTGVVPGTGKTLNDKVNVPSHFWTAYCCLDNNGKCKISRGFIGENKNDPPVNKTVPDIQTDLARLYQVSSFKIFN